jgi:hypothetical protein
LGAGTGDGYFHIKYGHGIGRYDLIEYIAGIDDGIFQRILFKKRIIFTRQ